MIQDEVEEGDTTWRLNVHPWCFSFQRRLCCRERGCMVGCGSRSRSTTHCDVICKSRNVKKSADVVFSGMLSHPLPLLDQVLCSSSMMWERHWSADSVCCETVKPSAMDRCCFENWTDQKRIKIPSWAVRTTYIAKCQCPILSQTVRWYEFVEARQLFKFQISRTVGQIVTLQKGRYSDINHVTLLQKVYREHLVSGFFRLVKHGNSPSTLIHSTFGDLMFLDGKSTSSVQALHLFARWDTWETSPSSIRKGKVTLKISLVMSCDLRLRSRNGNAKVGPKLGETGDRYRKTIKP